MFSLYKVFSDSLQDLLKIFLEVRLIIFIWFLGTGAKLIKNCGIDTLSGILCWNAIKVCLSLM